MSADSRTEEIMALAGLFATARVLRYRARDRDILAIAQTEARVVRAKARLRACVEQLCAQLPPQSQGDSA